LPNLAANLFGNILRNTAVELKNLTVPADLPTERHDSRLGTRGSEFGDNQDHENQHDTEKHGLTGR
jgi:hypothetical protein